MCCESKPSCAGSSHQPYGAGRGIQAFATLCCPPPAISPPSSRGHCYFSLSSMSLCHLHHHPSHQKTRSLSRCLWAERAGPRNHLLPQIPQTHLPNIIISIRRAAVLPSIPQPYFSPFLLPAGPPAPHLTPFALLTNMKQLIGELDSDLPSTEIPPAGLGEQPGTVRVNSEVVSVQLLPL